jgi:two-component SAPR family response regulator
MNAIIVDDEQPAIDVLKVMLEQDGRIEVAGTFRKPADALEAIGTLRPDVAFLDIQMPRMNGLELSERLLEVHEELEIVFVTAYDRFALEAFRANACDYLLKPVAESDLGRTIMRLYKRKRLPPKDALQPGNAIRAYCFGGFTLLGMPPEGVAIPWRTVKIQELMAYLLIRKGQQISKWEMINDIWPDCTEEQAHSHLHTAVYQIRKTLKLYGVNARIDFRNAHYRLEADGLWSDLEQFMKLSEGDKEVSSANAGAYEQCLELYKGELFGAWSYPWSIRLREACRLRYAVMTKSLCDYLIGSGQHQTALQRIQLLIDTQPLDEEAYMLSMRIYKSLNNRTAFISQYQKLERLLQAELGVLPEEKVRRLYESWAGIMTE